MEKSRLEPRPPDPALPAEAPGASAEAEEFPDGLGPVALRFDHPDPTEIPPLFPDLPPVGGVIRTSCEDFEVEEIPLYESCGEGEHLFLTVRKTNRTSLQVRDHLAREFGVRPDDVGFAGFKDKRAVAQQTFSIPTAAMPHPKEIERPWLAFVGATRHTNKLRTGHLAGNRFRIRIREVGEEALPGAAAIVARIAAEGLPNFYGPQRFGIHGDGHRIGAALLRRDIQQAVSLLLFPREGIDEPYRELALARRYEEALAALPPGRSAEAALLHTLRRHPGNLTAAARKIPRQLRRMYYSAYQSELFNWVLRERLEWGRDALSRLREGDLAFIHAKGACFRVDDPAREQSRADALEISPSGPMYGRKVLFAAGEMGRLERSVLAAEGLRRGSFVSHVKGLDLDGGRRPLRVPVREAGAAWDAADRSLVLRFTLPPGSFATTLLEQVMGPGRVAALARPDAEEEAGE
jgi:tRNA pseudouridine13 synthase